VRLRGRNSSPSVSIVLATHNRCDWLRLAMDSVLEQDYADLELLVMDDGSTDATPDLLRLYAQRHPSSRFRFARHENMGQARTLNRGYELARGEILGYLSDDDMLAPGAVSSLVAKLEDTQLVGAYPGYRIIDEDGEIVDTVRPIEYSPMEAYRLVDTVIGPGCLVRRGPLESTGGWDPELRFMGDFVLWLKLGGKGPIARVTDPLASWRRHGGGLSLQVAAAHGRELLRLVGLAAELVELPPDSLEVRAEALRNACIQAAFFGGGGGPSPGERFATIDMSRAGTSSFSAGLGLTGPVDERADEAVELWRELAGVTFELDRRRALGEAGTTQSPEGRRTGLEAAQQRLRLAGALPDESGGAADGWGRDDLRMVLMEAAVECGADVDLTRSRYLVIDRRADISPQELDELNHRGYWSPPERLRAVIADRRSKLDQFGPAQLRADR
jgi:hypothetical protein